MDYQRTMAKMLESLSANHTAEELTFFVRCLSFGLAQASTYVTTEEAQKELLDCIFDATMCEAKALFAQANGNGMDGAHFLEHCFHPEKFNG